jgi:hypothetical protein
METFAPPVFGKETLAGYLLPVLTLLQSFLGLNGPNAAY